jgi:hypothetical protein
MKMRKLKLEYWFHVDGLKSVGSIINVRRAENSDIYFCVFLVYYPADLDKTWYTGGGYTINC